jgi:hypothetical protein
MKNLTPENLVLRCYGHKQTDGTWYGVCLNLNIAIEANSTDELKQKMADAIVSYIETVYDTEDRASIAELLCRKAPFSDWFVYGVMRIMFFVKQLSDNITFKETIPIHLAHN